MANKGFPYERVVCHRLSAWWLGVPVAKCDDIIFWRTAGSGAHATVRARKGKKTSDKHGDIAAVDERGKALTQVFVIECKRGYGKFSITDLIDGGFKAEKGYEEWIRKLQDKCDLLGTPYWLLIHRKDNRQAMAYMPLKAWAALFDLVKEPTIQVHAKVDGIRHSIAGCQLEWLLDNITRRNIEELTGKKGE